MVDLLMQDLREAEPDFLYKYFSLREDNEEIIKPIFTDHKLYFASPQKFNDPFDCKLNISYEAPEKVIRKNLLRIFKTKADLNPSERLKEVNRIIRQKKIWRFTSFK